MYTFTKEDLDFLNKTLAGKSLTNVYEEVVSQMSEEEEDWGDPKKLAFWEQVAEALQEEYSVCLDGEPVNGPFAYEKVDDIMETLHYDNGEPLTTEEHDFFADFEDDAIRHEEYQELFNDCIVKKFVLRYGMLATVIDLTFDQLKNQLTKWYDGASYEHDFGDQQNELALDFPEPVDD